MKALKIGDQEVTVVWMPYNWGFKGLSTGPSVNYLTIDAGRSRAPEPRRRRRASSTWSRVEDAVAQR